MKASEVLSVFENVKNSQILSLIVGAIGGVFSALFGGWSVMMSTLLLFMGVDYLSGLVVAGVFKNSNKSETGALESGACRKGLARKGMMLLIVMIAYRMDVLIGTNYIRDAVTVAYCVSEAISILENAGAMGVPLPKVIVDALDMLKKKAEFDSEDSANE